MEISFKDDALRRLCTEERVMLRKLGRPGAKKLRARLKDLKAFENMAEVCYGRPHRLKGDLKDCIGLDLDGGRRLVLQAAHDSVPRHDDSSINWRLVTQVCVISIGNYHD